MTFMPARDLPGSRVTAPAALGSHVAAIAALFVLALLVWGGFAEGFLGRAFDDTQYAETALTWLQTAPSIGQTHWSLRLPLVLPMAGVFRIWGVSQETTLVVPVACSLALVVMTYACVSRWFGQAAAVLACILFIAVPQSIENATSANPDIVELMLVAASFWLLIAARRAERPLLLVVSSGILVSLAWLTRQTTAGYLVFLGLTFLFSPIVPRRLYFVLAAAAVPIVAAEHLFYFTRTGDWLYRLHVDMRHVLIPSAHLQGGVAADQTIPLMNMELASRWVQPGFFRVHWLIDPYLDFLADRHYGLLCLLSLPFGALAIARGRHDGRSRILVLLAAAGLAWVVVSIYVLAIRPQARYFGIVIYGAAILAGAGLAVWWTAGRRVLVAGIVAVTLVSNALLADAAQNRDEVAVALVELLRHTGEPAYVPQDLLDRAQLQIRSPDVLARVLPAPAPGRLAVRLATAPPPACAADGKTLAWPRVKWSYRLAQLVGLGDRLPRRWQGIEDPTRPVLVVERLCP